ncbi:MAG TPA: beta-galactosidase trimerization domain-containing protein [Actinotalea caeni]|uniref:beta-galactosidase trimerization domain-containing protein n=1 Tax=Actinotalea caeni TaxID=1348467 RepID=UPI002B4AAEED|nr:beta-galactosidase trimerization domain-containing protein [Actinotalea caeni]HLV56933.1 beta-galactosidase trimerization domain-containing protein [Actinotalea caeni]
MTQPWWRGTFRGFQTNLREIDPATLDVEEVLDVIEDYGADTWLLSVGGIVANYPSDLDCQTVNPALARRPSGDLVGDAVTAAAARGIRVLARMDFSKIDAGHAERHPEWCFVGPDGEQQVYNGYRSVCPSGEYYQERMFDVVGEVLARYDVRGFFFNMMHFNERDYSRRYRGVCQCEACRAAFARHSPGVPLPTGPDSPGYGAWRDFSEGVLEDLNVRMSAHIRSLAPDAALLLRDGADVTYHEANNAVGRPLWHLATSEKVSAFRGADRERAVYVNSVAFVDMPYRWAGEDPHHFAQYLLQAVAHGAGPSTYVMGVPSTGGYDCLAIGRELTRFHRDHAHVYDGLRSAAEVAVVRAPGVDAQPERLSEMRGWYQALLERHVPTDVVRLEQLALVEPERYRLLVVPHVGPLEADAAAAIDAVLAAGGAVVLTGDSGWVDGVPQVGGEPLARRLASYATEQALFSLHVALDGGHAPALGQLHVLEATDDARTDWPLLGRSTYGPPEKCYGNRPTGHHGWVERRVGPGVLGLVPWLPGLVYREVGLQRVRDAAVDQVLRLVDESRRAGLGLRTDLPAQVQVVLGRNRAGSTVVHLLNRSGDAPQRFVEPVPIAGGVVTIPVDTPPVCVRAHVAGGEVEHDFADGLLTVRTPELGLFEVLECVTT